MPNHMQPKLTLVLSFAMNFKSSKGNSSNEDVYEKFDRFLKDSFLEKCIQARKPKMHKAK
jgi:hypothetical protein